MIQTPWQSSKGSHGGVEPLSQGQDLLLELGDTPLKGSSRNRTQNCPERVSQRRAAT